MNNELQKTIGALTNSVGELSKNVKFILKSMATKKDIENMATKADLVGMASKKDLVRSLSSMASKKDLAKSLVGMSTKKDLVALEDRLRKDLASKKDLTNSLAGMATKDDLAKSLTGMATKDDLAKIEKTQDRIVIKLIEHDEMFEVMQKNMATTEQVNEVRDQVEGFIKLHQNLECEQAALISKTDRIDGRVIILENRLAT